MQYRAEIDGLRTIAVLPVILFHAGISIFSGGFVGVDVFFVISGYLITSIILRELGDGQYSIINFYERRARRILPALALVVACTIPPAIALLTTEELNDFGQSVSGVALFSSNIVFWLQADYFDTASELKPLLHTWSLGVEEQFYILVPPALALLWRFRLRFTFVAIAAGTIASFLLAEHLSRLHPTAAFYLLPTRAWELGTGALLAVWFLNHPLPRPGLVSHAGGLAGLALILYAVFAFDKSTIFPGAAALLPTVGSALIIAFAVKGTAAHRILASPFMVGIGLISYSAYLWHQPLFAFTRVAADVEPSPWLMYAMIPASLLLAWLSWRFVERPFRQRGRITRRQIFAMTFAVTIAMLAAGTAIQAGHVPIARWSAARFKPHLLAYEYDNSVLQTQSWQLLEKASGDPDYRVEGNVADQRLWFDPADRRQRLLVAGNSHSKDIYNMLMSSRAATGRFQIARFGAQIADLPDLLYAAPNYQAADVVLLASRYSDADIARLPAVVARLRADGKIAVLVRGITETRQYKGGSLNLADVTVIDAIARGQRDGAAIAYNAGRAYFDELSTSERKGPVARADAVIDRLVRRDARVIALDRMAYVCDPPRRRCFAMDNGLNKYFFDYGHQTLAGSRFFGERIDAIGWLGPLIALTSANPDRLHRAQ